jgi:uncharacterized protein
MDKTDVVNRMKEREHDLRQAGLSALYLFGSFARGESKAESDIDLACEIDSSMHLGLFEFAEIRSRLELLLGRHVDLVEMDAMHKRVLDHAKADMERIF